MWKFMTFNNERDSGRPSTLATPQPSADESLNGRNLFASLKITYLE